MKSERMSILAFRIFACKPFGNGGERREAQLDEIFRTAGIERTYYGMSCPPLSAKKWCRAIRLIARSQNRVVFRQLLFHPKSVYGYLRAWAWNVDSLEAFFENEERLFVYEGSAEFHYPVVEEALRRGKRVIAVMHNLESLVPGRRSSVTRHYAPADFPNEVALLRQCEMVFMISREETWLLRLWGVNAYYLPYYPAKECREWLLDIRKQRAILPKTKKPTYLVIGSAINQPTAIGMQQLVDYVVSHNMDIVLRIGGYGTDQHICLPKDCGNVVLLGELEQDQLTQEMIECDAILINQPPTTGALTRIVEAEIAGIPVVANTDSMRNYFNILGIYEYRRLDELADVLSQELLVPAIPEMPDCRLLLDAIKIEKDE